MPRPDTHKMFDQWLQDSLDQKKLIPLPNLKPIEDPQKVLEAIQYTKEMHIPYKHLLDLPHAHGTTTACWYPKIFTTHRGMGGHFDGSGVILSQCKAYTFAMCEHEWNQSGANHSRGWHPQVCTKCGFDASIDSGD